MSEVLIKLPESVMNRLSEIEMKEGITVQQFISSAVNEKLDAFLSEAYLEEKARRASREKFMAVLDKAPDVEPEEYDKL
jgi:hypothetical protein